MYTMYMKDFDIYISLVSYTFAIYYIIKSIIISKRMKKKYIQSLSDIEEIIKKWGIKHEKYDRVWKSELWKWWKNV